MLVAATSEAVNSVTNSYRLRGDSESEISDVPCKPFESICVTIRDYNTCESRLRLAFNAPPKHLL